MSYEKILLIETAVEILENLKSIKDIKLKIETFEGTTESSVGKEIKDIKSELQQIKKEILTEKNESIENKLILIGGKINSLIKEINKHSLGEQGL